MAKHKSAKNDTTENSPPLETKDTAAKEIASAGTDETPTTGGKIPTFEQEDLLDQAPNPEESAIPFSPSDYREDEPDPLDPKVQVVEIISLTPKWVIYLDQRHRIATQIPPDLSTPDVNRIIVRAEMLQALPVEHLTDDHIRISRVLIAQSIQAILYGDNDTATQNLSEADAFIRSRKAEIGRRWYIEGSTVGIVSIILIIAYLITSDWMTETASELATLACFGAVGAYLSTLHRITGFPWDPSAGRTLHYYESIARLITGFIGGLLIVIAAKAGVLFSFPADASDTQFWFAAIASFVAGISERLVPNFVQRIENQVATGRLDTQLNNLPSQGIENSNTI